MIMAVAKAESRGATGLGTPYPPRHTSSGQKQPDLFFLSLIFSNFSDLILLHFIYNSLWWYWVDIFAKSVSTLQPIDQILAISNIEIIKSKITENSKVEKFLKGSLDSIPSPSPSVKIQIMGRKVCLRCKGKTLLGVVNKLFVFKSLLTTHSNVLHLHLRQIFPPIFEFSLKVKVMGSNPGYLLKKILL